VSDRRLPDLFDAPDLSAVTKHNFEPPWRQRFVSGCGVRYPEFVATTLDKDKLHGVLDQAVIVIDEQDLERSRRDPRVRAFHESTDKLMEELEAEGANYD
jgi:hypothetical protein